MDQTATLGAASPTDGDAREPRVESMKVRYDIPVNVLLFVLVTSH